MDNTRSVTEVDETQRKSQLKETQPNKAETTKSQRIKQLCGGYEMTFEGYGFATRRTVRIHMQVTLSVSCLFKYTVQLYCSLVFNWIPVLSRSLNLDLAYRLRSRRTMSTMTRTMTTRVTPMKIFSRRKDWGTGGTTSGNPSPPLKQEKKPLIARRNLELTLVWVWSTFLYIKW